MRSARVCKQTLFRDQDRSALSRPKVRLETHSSKGRIALLRPEVCFEPCGIVTVWKERVSRKVMCGKTSLIKNAENQMKVTLSDSLTQAVS